MEWRQLEYFRKTAQLEHISKSADELHLTQPSLTMSIRKLEDELGVELFDRRGRGIVLNDFGKLFLERVNTIFSIIEQTKQDLSDMRLQLNNRISLMVPPPLYNPELKELLCSIVPGVALEPLRFTFSPLNMLLDGSLDMFVMTPAVKDPRVLSLPIINDKSLVLIPEQHPLAQCKELSLYDLKDENFVSYRHGIPARTRLESSCQKLGFTPHIVFEGGTLRDMLPCLHASSNVAVVSAFALSLYNISGLCTVPLRNGDMLDSVMELCWLKDSEKGTFATSIADTVHSFISTHFSG